MRILFLHDGETPHTIAKRARLFTAGHDVVSLACHRDSFDRDLRSARREFEHIRPDVVVGASLGGAAAMSMEISDTPVVLLCPIWKWLGTPRTVDPNTIVIHGIDDSVVPFVDSEELLRVSRVGAEALIEVEGDHDLASPNAIDALVTAVEEVVRRSMVVTHLVRMRKACEDDAKCVLPIYGVQDGKPIQDRSGVLMAIAEKRFLVTAAHRLKEITDASIPLYATSPLRGQGGVPLAGRLHATEERKIDLAVMDLSDDTRATLEGAGARFLRVTDMDNRHETQPGWFLVRGYPLDCNASPMTFSTVIYQGVPPDEPDYPYDPTIHLLLDHSKSVRAGTGIEHRSPRIVGMSGCGIWRLTTRPPANLSSWTPEERRLVAIQTKCKYGNYLKGTMIRHVFSLIYHRCPELRRVMSSLHFPVNDSA